MWMNLSKKLKNEIGLFELIFSIAERKIFIVEQNYFYHGLKHVYMMVVPIQLFIMP